MQLLLSSSLFLLGSFLNAYTDFNPQPLLGNYHRDYTWGRIASLDGKLCMEEKDHQVWFNECGPGPTKDDINVFVQLLKQYIYYSQYWLYNDEHLHGLSPDGQVDNNCIDLPSEKHGKEGTIVKRKGCNLTVYQRFELIHAKGSGDDALFMFRSRDPKAKNQCLDMNGGYKPVHIWSCDPNNTNQTFKLMPSFAQFLGHSPHSYDAFPDGAIKEFAIDTANWMFQLYNLYPNTALKDIVIPGTHNSATFDGFSAISKTQEESILAQLEAGIRYLDLRLGADDKITHGKENGPKGSITRTITDIAKFSAQHPKEIIFVDIHELPSDDKNLNFIAKLINENLLGRLQPAAYMEGNRWIDISVLDITFQQVWKTDKNIILLVRNWHKLASRISEYNLWDKSLGIVYFNNDSANGSWEEVWPNETNFGIIYKKNGTGLLHRNDSKWHMSELIRTPKTKTAVATTLGFFGGVKELVFQKTDDGNFNLSIGKWIYNWSQVYGLPVNLVNTDFFNRTQIVPTALWLNKKKLLAKR